ncbi:MAG: hypothetical protein Q9214_002336 [Letrouitia sp. 1 TL-2023]
MASQNLDQQDENTPPQTAREVLVGRSMISRQPTTRLNVEDGNPMIRVNPMQEHQNVQLQDLDAFPSLQTGIPNQSGSESYSYPASPLGNNPIAPRRTLDQRSSSINRLSASPRSNSSRPTSRHRSRDPSPFISSIKDTEAFPTLGAAGSKNTKKHHGKRGGHGHGYGNKESLQQISSLADVVRMSPSPAPESHRKGFGKNRSSSTSCENNAAAMAIPPPQRVPWLETGEAMNHAYMNARQDAIRHANARNKFLQSAAQAWNRNDARAAKALSLRGQSENDSMRKAHREAARILYHERNKDNLSSQELYVDLHGLHPEEAIEYLEQALLEHQHSSHPVYAITGTGHHSKAGKDKVGKAIRGWLNAWKYAFREFSVVGDNLGGILGINPSSFDESKMEDSEEQVKDEGKLRDTTAGKIRIIQRSPATKGEAG